MQSSVEPTVMGEHILRLTLAELHTVRVKCKACEAVMELSAKSIGGMTQKCPQCNVVLFSVGGSNDSPFSDLQTVLAKIEKLSAVDVEFPVSLDGRVQ